MAPTVKRLSTVWETWVWSLGWEDSLEKEMATHSSTLALKIPWTEEPGAGYCPWGCKESGTTSLLLSVLHPWRDPASCSWCACFFLSHCPQGSSAWSEWVWELQPLVWPVLHWGLSCLLHVMIFQFWLLCQKLVFKITWFNFLRVRERGPWRITGHWPAWDPCLFLVQLVEAGLQWSCGIKYGCRGRRDCGWSFSLKRECEHNRQW